MADIDSESSYEEEEVEDSSSSSLGASFEEETYESETSSVASPPINKKSSTESSSMETPVGSSEYSASLAGGISRDSDSYEDEEVESTDASSSHVDDETTSVGDDSTLSAELPSPSKSGSKWRETYRSLSNSHHNNKDDRDDSSSQGQQQQQQGLFGGPADFGGSTHYKSNEVLENLSSKTLEKSNHSDASYSSNNQKEDLAASISSMNPDDAVELRDMLVASDDEEMERSFQKLISPGHVQAGKQYYETLKDQPPPRKAPLDPGDDHTTDDDDDDEMEYGSLKDDKKAPDAPTDEETRLLILQRRAEKARGDPSDYHSDDDDDDALLLDDLAQKENESSDTSSSDEEDDDSESDLDSIDPSAAFAEQASKKWEDSVAAEGDDLENSFQRQKDIILNSDRQQRSERSIELASEHTANKSTRTELREELQSQVKERIQTEDDDVKRELERSLHRDKSRRNPHDSSSSSSEEAMEAGLAKDEDSLPKDVDVKKSPVQEVLHFMASNACLYFMCTAVFLLVIAVIVLAVFFARA